MSMVRQLFYRLRFEREQRRLCDNDKCSVITPMGVKGIGYCARCGREYLYLKFEGIWTYAGTKRRLA
jgi:hypothetical protein